MFIHFLGRHAHTRTGRRTSGKIYLGTGFCVGTTFPPTPPEWSGIGALTGHSIVLVAAILPGKQEEPDPGSEVSLRELGCSFQLGRIA